MVNGRQIGDSGAMPTGSATGSHVCGRRLKPSVRGKLRLRLKETSHNSHLFDFAQGAFGSEGVIRTFSIVFGGALSFVLIVVLSFYFAAG